MINVCFKEAQSTALKGKIEIDSRFRVGIGALASIEMQFQCR